MIPAPSKRETLVLPVPIKIIRSRLSRVINPVTENYIPEANTYALFNGWIHDGQFKISVKVNYPQNYLPLIKGTIIPSSKGCIIFLTYRLFFSSLMFLAFWSVMCIMISIFFAFIHKEYTYALLSFAAGLSNYAIAILNFKIQLQKSREILLKSILKN